MNLILQTPVQLGLPNEKVSWKAVAEAARGKNLELVKSMRVDLPNRSPQYEGPWSANFIQFGITPEGELSCLLPMASMEKVDPNSPILFRRLS